MHRLTALAACLVALVAVPLAGCGDKAPGVSKRQASELVHLLRRAQSESDNPQRCNKLLATISSVSAKVQALPSKVDADVRESLSNGVKNLDESARSQCAKAQTTPTTTATTPTATVPTTPPATTATTPTPTTPTTPPTTTTPSPPPTTTAPTPTTPAPGTGGTGPGNAGTGGAVGNGQRKPFSRGGGAHGHKHKPHSKKAKHR